MAITITHPFVSAKPDGTDASLIQPSNWNDNHSVIGTVDVANGGTGATTASAARTNLGLGTMATQNANNVSITGGSMTGVTLTSLDASTTFQDNADPTKQMQFQLSSITGGQTSVLTVPDADGTLVLEGATQTLTNKTLTSPTISGGSITGITDLALADGGTGASLTDPNADRIMFWDDSAGAVTWLTAGTGLTITDTTITATSGTGDVVGPASSTDNAVVRFDGTTGKLIQNSAVTVADTTGDITGGTYNGLTVLTGTNTATLTRGTAALTWTTTGTLGSAAFTASTDYAVAAKGVTNGDTHDHSGGDGAQIAYTSLSGLPTLGTIASQAANNVSITGGSITGITDLALADGGTGASLTDPNADRIMFWDDSAGAVTWLTAGTGLTITDTTISAAGDVAGPTSSTDNAVVRFDGTTGKLVQDSAVTIADTTGDITAGAYNGLTVSTGTNTATLTRGTAALTFNSSGTIGSLAYKSTISNDDWSGNDLSLANGGTGASLTDPNADRLFFWDDSASSTAFLTVGTGLTVTDTTITNDAVGKQTIWIPATAMVARTTNGASSGTAETSTNKVMLKTLDFDTATAEYAQFMIQMPKSWNESTVTFQAVWSHAATTTNFGVAWSLQGVAISNDDTADAAFGTKQTVTDTGGTTNDIYITSESSAVTIAGTPAAQDWVVFQVERTVSDGGDTMAIDARLHGIQLFYTTDAGNDA